jgi:cytochrome c oxidase subunit 2
MNETLFYVLGITLTVMALLVAFVGLRLESFPSSKALMGGVVAVFAFFVIGTAVFAWRNGEDEQAHRDAELAEAAEESEAPGGEAEASLETGGEAPTPATETAAADGAAVFEEQGCGSCHTLAAAGSTGETGPDLDGALADRDPGYIEESIVDPAAVVAEGYPPNIMPNTYDDLPPEELDGLVQYLAESTQ